MLGKIFKISVAFLVFVLFFLILKLLLYWYNQHENQMAVDMCKNNTIAISDNIAPKDEKFLYKKSESASYNPDSCFCRMYNLLLPELLVYKVKADNKDLEFTRFSWDSYIIPTIAMEKADFFISYGTAYNVLFEDNLSAFYKKKLFAYDCGVDSIEDLIQNNPYITFGSECIGTDKFILTNLGQVSSQKIHSLGQKIKELKAENKKIFIKMDIAGAEIEVIPDIVRYADNLTGISIVIRLDSTDRIVQFKDLIKSFDKDFVLVARNGIRGESYQGCKCKYVKGEISNSIALSYINKNLIDKKYLPIRQDYHENGNFKTFCGVFPSLPPYNIDWEVVTTEKLKNLAGLKND
ncbi:MAG: hypothetical protein K6C94_03500 [Candidatus Gastranaerophilales bacterium]|nr:hypothetical protein [Candidatus Gastranaerophilales bacterium]